MAKSIQLSEHFSYRKLMRFTLPSIAMMIFTSIYSVVDGFFVSNFAGKEPFAAVNLIMPVLQILGTFGFMLGTGGTAIVSKAYGEGDRDRANRYFSLFVYIAFGTGILLAALGIAFIKPIAELLGAEGELISNCVTYATIILCALPFYVLQMMFQSFFVAAEKPKLGLAVTVSAGMTNIVLDAVLVMLLPQQYKLAGAAIATALSQAVGGIIPLVYFFNKNSSVLRLGKTRFDAKALLKACTNGSSEFMSNISMNLVGMLYNKQLLHYLGNDGVAAYGVMMYVSMIFSAAFLGYTIGVAPVIGFHYGAQNHEELQGLRKKSLRIITVFGIAMTLLAELLAVPVSAIFVGYDAKLLDITVSGFKIFALCFAFMGFGIFTSGFFTALGDGLTSALIAFLRTLLFQTAAILILPAAIGVDGIWISVVVAEIAAMMLGIAFIAAKRRKYNY